MVPERDSGAVRCYAEHLAGLGLCDRKTGFLTSTARHIAVWLSIDEAGLDTFDVRLLDRFMRHECRCPGQRRTGRHLFLNAMGRGMTRRGFAMRLELHATTAARTKPSIARRKVTPHVLRHACALATLEATGDIRKVSLWLGHQSLQTTEMYLRTDPAEKLDMLSEWHSPGLGKGRFTGVKDTLMEMLSNV